ncbi:U3 small nucleolar RNA-interacting protein 2 isoform X1 [Chiloscyllium plagiosum]|uniref:U3 small nucleolar RNA-interacting protein 2 isoform X1 n=2 Tax=Chiloscyllium plagiosum TaxID=36176 RepID=UPI001CB7B4CC|nr:U3 small nucleolar RNA-interacting protein 2 isoform X1 [Chiloscyllium plagiosum]
MRIGEGRMAAAGSFFIRKKRAAAGEGRGRKRKVEDGDEKVHNKRPVRMNEEISSDSETESDRPNKDAEELEIEETAQEKKLRLAKLYLEQLQKEEEEKADEEQFERDLFGSRLEEEVLEQKGKLKRLLAKDYLPPDESEIRLLRGHQLPVTCLVLSPDDKYIFSASKDCSIIKWDVTSGKKVHTIHRGHKGAEGQQVGHTMHILSMAISSDSKYLATGDRNKLILIWNAASCQHLYTFKGHKDAVSGLSFRKGTHQLYSASHDRSVKVWNVDQSAYVETMFGHQDAITGLDSLSRERCVTAGGRDRTVRVWKIVEEAQLVFHGHESSIDCIQLMNEEYMISGGDDGSLALWTVTKKRPLMTVRKAHGIHGDPVTQQPYWITSVAALLNSDLIASGSHNSKIRLWKCGEGFKTLEPLFDIPMVGFVNCLKFSSSGEFLVAGMGQEHRLGRWWRLKEAKNGICIIPLKKTSPKQQSGDNK